MRRRTWSVVIVITMALFAAGSVPAPRGGGPAGSVDTAPTKPSARIPSFRELGKSKKFGRTFRNFVVSEPINRDELIALAENVHRLYPDDAARFFDDDAKFTQFLEWDKNYPDKDYPFPKEWASNHYLALLNLTGSQGGSRWELVAEEAGGRFIQKGDTAIAVIK